MEPRPRRPVRPHRTGYTGLGDGAEKRRSPLPGISASLDAVDDDTQGTDAGTGGTLRALFPGLFTPGQTSMERFYREGLVVLDTNALFDVYRLTGTARSQFLGVLELLGEQLWIPHRVAQEFLERRPTVIRECKSQVSGVSHGLGIAFEDMRSQILQAFLNRCGLDGDDSVEEMTKVLNEAQDQLIDIVTRAYAFDVEEGAAPDDDPIYQAVAKLIDGRIGPRLADEDSAEQEGHRRIKEKIPPGFADAGKSDPQRQIGDYFVWAQTIERARLDKRPVLMVTNDKKDDWIRKESGRTTGPRPELIEEMLREAGQPFHLVNVRTFLVDAGKYLAATVSPSTVDQAERLLDTDDEDDEDVAVPESRPTSVTEQRLDEVIRRFAVPQADTAVVLAAAAARSAYRSHAEVMAKLFVTLNSVPSPTEAAALGKLSSTLLAQQSLTSVALANVTYLKHPIGPLTVLKAPSWSGQLVAAEADGEEEPADD
jgi:hypothetical protein